MTDTMQEDYSETHKAVIAIRALRARAAELAEAVSLVRAVEVAEAAKRVIMASAIIFWSVLRK